MKKLASILTLVLLSASTFAQKSILFKYAYHPNKTYKTASIISANMKMIMLDSLGKPDTSKVKNGAMNMNYSMDFGASIKTGALGTDKKIPFTLTYDKAVSEMEMAGQKQAIPIPSVKDMKMIGFVKNGNQLQIDSISGLKDQAQKELMTKMITKLQEGIKFPNRPIKVGDTFSVAMPLDIPMGVAKMDMKIQMIYKLISIKGNKGYLDYTAVMDMSVNGEDKPTMKMTGNGAGNVVYDLTKEFVTKQHGTMQMKMDMAMKPVSMKMDMNLTNDVNVTID